MMIQRIITGLAVLLCAILILGAIGCGGNKGNPEQTVRDFWSAFENGEFEKASTFLEESKSSKDLEAIYNEKDFYDLADKVMNMETTGSTVEGDTAIVNVDLTKPDKDLAYEEVAEAFYDEYLSNMSSEEFENYEQLTEEQQEEIVQPLLDAATPELIEHVTTTTESGEVVLIWQDGAWKIAAIPALGI